MVKVIFLFICVLMSTQMIFSQNVYDVTSRVKASDIKDAKLRKAFEAYQAHNYYLNLPLFKDKLHGEESYKTSPSYGYEDQTSPFYVNQDPNRCDFYHFLCLIECQFIVSAESSIVVKP